MIRVAAIRVAAIRVAALAAILATACAPPPAPLVVPTVEGPPAPAPQIVGAPQPAPPPTMITSIGPVEIGMTIDEVRARIGPELRRDDFTKERDSFASFNYDLARTVPFILGFDEVFVFNDDKLRSEPPIWKLYVRAGRVAMIKITTVGFDDYFHEHKVGFAPSCFLLDPPAGIQATFGDAFVHEDLADHATLHYFERGVSVMIFDDAIRVFDVYGDVGDAMRAKLRAALAKPKP